MTTHIVPYLGHPKSKKTLFGFLIQHQHEIAEYVAGTSTIPYWEDFENKLTTSYCDDLDLNWFNIFLQAASKFDENLSGRVKLERERIKNGLKTYWTEVLEEIKLRQNLSLFNIKKEKLLKELSDTENAITCKQHELSMILNRAPPEDEEDLVAEQSNNFEDFPLEVVVDDNIPEVPDDPDEVANNEVSPSSSRIRKRKNRDDGYNNDDNYDNESS
ncbi:43265_t:CDS:2, partial [Gigaspora margarita]